jgi:hypothetical protein
MLNRKNIGKALTSILVGALFVLPLYTFAQQDTLIFIPDSNNVTETTVVEEPVVDTTIKGKERNHSHRVAVISSTIIPGLGQAYNRKYWKIPIIYGGGAIIYYFFDYNNTYYQRLKTAYNQLKNGEEITDPDLKEGWDEQRLMYHRDNFRRNRDYNIIFFGLLYVANIVDAMVDAYMYSYDISPDLSMQIAPSIIPPLQNTYATASCGLKIKFSF